MHHWRIFTVVVSLVLAPLAAGAAPAGKVVIAQGVDPTTLDMMNQQEQPASNVGAQMFESLLERDQSLKLVPALAVEMPKLVAPTTWEFKLRKGVKFHNGEDFTAESVKFSIERLANPANKLRGSTSFAPIDRVEIVDPFAVRIHTKKPWPVFLSHIALRQAAMYPPKEHAGKDAGAISKNPIGTGPYKFVRWSKDDEIVMEAFPGYWGGAAEDQDRRVQADSRRPRARGRAPERRDRRRGEHPAPPGRHHRQAPARSSSARRRRSGRSSS